MKTRFTLPFALCLTMLSLAAEAQQNTANFGTSAYVSGGGSAGGAGSMQASRSYQSNRANGWAMASLASGSLHAVAGVDVVPCSHCGTNYDGKSGLQARAVMWDTVSFHNGRANGLMDFKFQVEGTLSHPWQRAYVRYYFGSPKTDFFKNPTKYATFQSLGNGVTPISDDLLVPLGDSTWFVYAELVVQAVADTISGGYVDFGNSLHFSWDLPEGVTYRSGSGTFLSAAPVPEPQSWALMALGLAGVGALARRRRA